MDSMKYQNISKLPQALSGHGTVEPGATIQSEKIIENANFKQVEDKPKASKKDIKNSKENK